MDGRRGILKGCWQDSGIPNSPCRLHQHLTVQEHTMLAHRIFCVCSAIQEGAALMQTLSTPCCCCHPVR